MVPEVEVLEHVYHIVQRVFVLLPEMIQDPDLDQRLVVKPFFVPDDLDGHMLICFVVQGSDDLSEAALADHLEDFVPIRYMIMENLE